MLTESPKTYRLRFTGSCSEDEFRARCAEHDYWYHSFYFDNGFEQRGDYDIGRDLESYGFPDDMSGMSVLDVGTGSGWFATFFEQRGGDVTTVDLRGISDFDVFGRPAYPDISEEKPDPDVRLPDGRELYFSPVSKGFWIMKDLLGLKAEYANARVYELAPSVFGGKTFDFVFVGAVLMHLRDPIGALMAIRTVSRGRVIATSFLLDGGPHDPPLMQLLQGDKIAWWAPNRRCLIAWFEGAGFGGVDLDGTIRLSVDRPYVDAGGHSSATEQVFTRVEARV
jgi:SAM-dependent methyltransferase